MPDGMHGTRRARVLSYIIFISRSQYVLHVCRVNCIVKTEIHLEKKQIQTVIRPRSVLFFLSGFEGAFLPKKKRGFRYVVVEPACQGRARTPSSISSPFNSLCGPSMVHRCRLGSNSGPHSIHSTVKPLGLV